MFELTLFEIFLYIGFFVISIMFFKWFFNYGIRSILDAILFWLRGFKK